MQGRFTCVLLASFYSIICWGQGDSAKSCRSFYIGPEFLLGTIAPNYEPYPSSGLKETLVLDIGSSNIDDKPWAKYYNHPDIGVGFSFSQLGNERVFGNEFDVMPYITLNTSRRLKNAWYIKVSMGASYFTKRYDTFANPENLAIGSSVTWAFKAFIYRDLWATQKYNLRIGGGYCHSSDGHTQLPNLGLNSVLLGLSLQFRNHEINPDYIYPEKSKEQIPDNYFLQIRTGFGFHERGSPFGPVEGAKYGVASAAISGGVIFKKYLKLRAGFTYRDYGTLIDYTKPSYTTWQASNIFFSLGCEFLIGHIGMDIEGGITLYRPWYRQFYKIYEGSTSSFFYFAKSTFPMRLGLNYYFINPLKETRCNVFIGADIDANFGQADFSEISLGYSVRI